MTTLNFKLPILLGREPFTLLTQNGPNPEFPIVGYGAPYNDTGKTNIHQFNVVGEPESNAHYDWMHLKQAPLKVSGHMVLHAYDDGESLEVLSDFVSDNHDLKHRIESIESRHHEILAVIRVEHTTALGTMELPAEPVLEQIVDEFKDIGG